MAPGKQTTASQKHKQAMWSSGKFPGELELVPASPTKSHHSQWVLVRSPRLGPSCAGCLCLSPGLLSAQASTNDWRARLAELFEFPFFAPCPLSILRFISKARHGTLCPPPRLAFYWKCKEIGVPQIWGQLAVHSKTLSQTAKKKRVSPCVPLKHFDLENMGGVGGGRGHFSVSYWGTSQWESSGYPSLKHHWNVFWA